MTDDQDSWPLSRCLLAALLVILALRWKWLDAPFFRDEALFAYMGRRVLEGHLPYVAVLHQMGPLLPVLQALGLLIGGVDQEFGPHLVAALCDGVALGFCLHLAGRRLGRIGMAGCLAGWLLVDFAPASEGLLSCSEILTLPFVCAALWWSQTHPRGWIVGLWLSLAVALRQTAVLFAPVVLLALPNRRERALFCASLLFSQALIPLFYASQGLGPLWFDAIFPNIYVYRYSAEGGFLPMVRYAASQMGLVFALALWFLMRSRQHRLWVWSLGLVCGLYAVYSPHRYFGRNWLSLLPFLALASAWCLSEAHKRWGRAIWLVPLLNAAGAAHFWFLSGPDYIARYHGQVHNETKALGALLAKSSRPQDTIFCWGNEWGLYFYSERNASSRHVMQNQLVYATFCSLTGHRWAEPYFWAWQKQIVEELQASPPRFIVLSAPLFDFKQPQLYFLPGILESMLRDAYHELPSPAPHWRIYRRKV